MRLRLLELPDAAREWVQVLLRVLLKYRSLVRPGQLAAELVDVSKSIRELRTLLSDAAHTRFVVVTRAAAVPRLETERLLDRLRRLKLCSAGDRGERDDARARPVSALPCDGGRRAARPWPLCAGAAPRGRTGALSSRPRCPRRRREV